MDPSAGSAGPEAVFVRGLTAQSFHQVPDPAIVEPGAGAAVQVVPIAEEPATPEAERLALRWQLAGADRKERGRGSASWHPALPLGPPLALRLPDPGAYSLSIELAAGGGAERRVIKRVTARTAGIEAARGLSDEEVEPSTESFKGGWRSAKTGTTARFFAGRKTSSSG